MNATALLQPPPFRSSATEIQGRIDSPVADPGTPTYRPLEWLDVPGWQSYFVTTSRSPEPSVTRLGLFERLVKALETGLDVSITPSSTPVPVSVVAPAAAQMSAVGALDAIRTELGVTLDEIARMTGIGRTTLHYWRRTGADPRPSTVGPLWRLHALGRALAGSLGRDRALGWLRSGSPSPLDLLMNGDFAAVEDLASPWLFSQPSLRYRGPSLAVDEEPEPPVEGTAAESARHSRRRPVRPR